MIVAVSIFPVICVVWWFCEKIGNEDEFEMSRGQD